MQCQLHHHLILFGFKSSGKTRFGTLLAQELGMPFVDTDHLIERAFEQEFHQVCSCRHIAIQLGEDSFRMLEQKVIDDLQDMSRAIIALGGGAVLNPENCLKLRKIGRLVYLEEEKETIRVRILRDMIPSFLDRENMEKSFNKMYEERKPIYESVSPFRIKMHGKSDRHILDELKDLLLIKLAH